MTERRAFTLVEIMVVTILSLLLIGGVYRFLIGTTRLSYQGVEKLENLNTARIILEKCSRDIKCMCSSAAFPAPIRQTGADGVNFMFPAFPNEGMGTELESDSNPVNLIAYTLDKKREILYRSVLTHPLMAAGDRLREHEIGRGIVDFEIKGFHMWGGLFQIRVKVKGEHPQREEPIELQTSVRSMYFSRAVQHLYQVPNLNTSPELPPVTSP